MSSMVQRDPSRASPNVDAMLQNNLHELWSLLYYLYPKVFVDSEPFDSGFDLNTRSVDTVRDSLP